MGRPRSLAERVTVRVRRVFFSRDSESPASVGAMGLHQPSAEERHRGHRKRHQNQQDLAAAGRGQISLPKPEGEFQ